MSTPRGAVQPRGWPRALTILALPCLLVAATSGAMGASIATLEGHSDSVTALAFSPDGKVVAASSLDKTVILWDVHSHEMVNTLQHNNSVLSVVFSQNGAAIATGGGSLQQPQGEARLWDMHTGRLTASLDGVAGAVTSLAFGPDGKTLAIGSRDGAVRIWESATDKVRIVLQGQGIIMGVAFTPDGAVVAAGTGATGSPKADELWMWKVAGPNVSATSLGRAASLVAVSFSTDGTSLATGSRDGLVKLWSVGKSRSIASIQAQTSPVLGLAVSPDGKLVACGSEDGARIWNPAEGRVRPALRGHTAPVGAVAFGAGGALLATGSGDKTVRLWNVHD